MTSAPQTDIRALVERVCAEMGLDDFVANTVEQWVEQPPAMWASCCLGSCDPCNDVVRAAALRVLAALDSERP